MKTPSLMAALVLATALPASADTLLNPLFQDHAVLQRDTPVRVWGTAAPNAAVTVSVAGQSAEAHAGADGHWQASLPALKAGGPYVLTAKTDTGATQTVNDVLVGDVYLCSGQSNMAFPVLGAIDAGPDIQSSANDSIRLMNVENVTSLTPLSVLPKPVSWAAASPQTVARFSAACYFFGRDLQQSLHVPIGLIESAWSGAGIQTFMSEESLRHAGETARVEALNLYARDHAAGMKHWGELIEAFWRQHGQTPWTNPAVSANWPQAPKDLGIWTTWGVPSLADYAGHVWYRTSIDLTAAQAAQAAELSLGTVTEEDETWVNGKFIASTFGYGQPRSYALPAGALHEGANDILVNDYCGWKGCGLFGPPEARAIKFQDGTSVPLAGPWHYKPEPGLTAPRVPWGATAGVSVAYNAMIAPLTPYNFKGVLWYQGESNTGEPKAYRGLLTAWMEGWRQEFQTSLPFLIVQLPDFGQPPITPQLHSDWASLRESQRLAVKDDSNAALTVTIDIGDHMGLHPAAKQEVGRRLALDARKLIYGEAITTGPVPVAATRAKGHIAVRFAGFDHKLVTVSSSQPIGFELCDTITCRFASATIHGDAVALALPTAFTPTRVRYCWADGPVCTLYDAARLPAVPFEMPIEEASAARGQKHHR